MADLADTIERTDLFTIRPAFTFFHNADGTNYVSEEAGGSIGWFKHGRVEDFGGGSRLETSGQVIVGAWGGANLEYRFNADIAIRAEGRGTHFNEAQFSPFTGELDAIITPTDRTRIDFSVAHIVIAGNVAALQHHLIGTFGSGGLDFRLNSFDRISLGVDGTSWADGNRRIRFHVTPAHQFEGVPHIILSLPFLYQNYDRPFTFYLFSPKSYVELAPAVNVYLRRARFWAFSFYAHVGTQKETSQDWKSLGTFRVTVEHELWKVWGFHAAVQHSTSNLASATGFSRTTVSISLTRRF